MHGAVGVALAGGPVQREGRLSQPPVPPDLCGAAAHQTSISPNVRIEGPSRLAPGREGGSGSLGRGSDPRARPRPARPVFARLPSCLLVGWLRAGALAPLADGSELLPRERWLMMAPLLMANSSGASASRLPGPQAG